jgi:hypothetical protein
MPLSRVRDGALPLGPWTSVIKCGGRRRRLTRRSARAERAAHEWVEFLFGYRVTSPNDPLPANGPFLSENP